MNRKGLSTLGLALRAGKVIPGLDLLSQTRKPLPLILVAQDASERVTRSLEGRGHTLLPVAFTKTEIGRALGCKEVAAAGVTDAGFAESIRKNLFQEENE